MNLSQLLQTVFGVQFLQTLIGAIVGGIIVIATNSISAQRARRESIQDWNKQIYITDGVDPLITFFVDLEFHLTAGQPINLATVPTAALARIQILLDSSVLTRMARFLQQHEEGIDLRDTRIRTALSSLRRALLELRKELLRIIPTTVHEKNYQLTPSENTKQMFKQIYNDLKVLMPDSLKE